MNPRLAVEHGVVVAEPMAGIDTDEGGEREGEGRGARKEKRMSQ